ncbi:MAG: hypothetical protein JO031_03940 [Ktedonobacteraceae bacterium]|nr:hypothetical protein [Ktedonobacteraceae bacterium]
MADTISHIPRISHAHFWGHGISSTPSTGPSMPNFPFIPSIRTPLLQTSISDEYFVLFGGHETSSTRFTGPSTPGIPSIRTPPYTCS